MYVTSLGAGQKFKCIKCIKFIRFIKFIKFNYNIKTIPIATQAQEGSLADYSNCQTGKRNRPSRQFQLPSRQRKSSKPKLKGTPFFKGKTGTTFCDTATKVSNYFLQLRTGTCTGRSINSTKLYRPNRIYKIAIPSE